MDLLLGHLRAISWPVLLWSGLAAYVLSTWVLMVLRKLGATRYLPRAYWSCALTGGASNAALVFAGLVRLLMMVGVFPIAYALLFAYMGKAEVLPGMIIGAIHGVVAGILLPLAARRCDGAVPPGLLGWRLGKPTPLVLLFVHAVYGAMIGYVYLVTSS